MISSWLRLINEINIIGRDLLKCLFPGIALKIGETVPQPQSFQKLQKKGPNGCGCSLIKEGID